MAIEYILDMMPGKVAVVLDPPDETLGKEGLLVRPDTAKGDGHLGTVLAVRLENWIEPGTHYMQMPKVHVGDRVVVGKYAGVPIEFNGEEVRIFKHQDILARLADPNAPRTEEEAQCGAHG